MTRKTAKQKKPAMNPFVAAYRRFLVNNDRPVEAKVSANDELAADLAGRYDEPTLRKAVAMSAAVAREALLSERAATGAAF